LFFLLLRDLKLRYRETALGPLVIFVEPLVQMGIFSLIFGGVAKLPSQGVPYPLFACAGLLPWRFFARSAANAANSLRTQAQLLPRAYFPRLLLPVSSVLSAFVDFLASCVILMGLMVFYHVPLSRNMYALPFFLLLAGAAGFALGLWLACEVVKFRDLSIGLGIALNAWFYLTPVVYAGSLIPHPWQVFYKLNPMAGIVEGFRWALLDVGSRPDWALAAGSVVVAAGLVAGAFSFRRSERSIVDRM
jgi:lipopolysaccharide transport system permease protein